MRALDRSAILLKVVELVGGVIAVIKRNTTCTRKLDQYDGRYLYSLPMISFNKVFKYVAPY